ncbi:SAV_6107 family HEPN domain-containing protein [Kineococcus glutinatus]|uniref:SAV-6107-like HEPN domain-containing protein n=1 Tax=Kineococcus glutinatus TaxID=1070872 RepID=A0ABP9I3S0_9ACTN
MPTIRTPPSRTGAAAAPAAAPAERLPITPAAFDLLERSRLDLLESWGSEGVAERYLHAHLAALRCAAAVLAVRGRPRPRRGGSTPRSAWETLPLVAPELAGWAAVFAASAQRRAAIEAGRHEVVDEESAEEVMRQAEAFHRAVETVLGLPPVPLLPPPVPGG